MKNISILFQELFRLFLNWLLDILMVKQTQGKCCKPLRKNFAAIDSFRLPAVITRITVASKPQNSYSFFPTAVGLTKPWKILTKSHNL